MKCQKILSYANDFSLGNFKGSEEAFDTEVCGILVRLVCNEFIILVAPQEFSSLELRSFSTSSGLINLTSENASLI